MKPTIFTLLTLALFACGRTTKPDDGVPSALQDPTVVGEIAEDVKSSYSRMGYGEDLVQKLFTDVLEKDSALAALLGRVDEQFEMHGDTLSKYDRFVALNDAYYGSAEEHAKRINDTTARAEQLGSLERSRGALEAQLAPCATLQNEYIASTSRANDLITLIKLQRTLALMEEHQRREPSHVATWQAEVLRMQELEKELAAKVK